MKVVEDSGSGQVVVSNNTTLELRIYRGTDTAGRQRLLNRWYRQHLRMLIPPLLARWATLLGTPAAVWGIKLMKTKWGACNPAARRIWLNLELAKKPAGCLEYIIVHELTHLLERHHDDRFITLMDQHLPNWRQRRQELNAAPLAHGNWSY